MSAFSGPQQAGAMRARRAAKKHQAEERDAAAAADRRAAFRRLRQHVSDGVDAAIEQLTSQGRQP